MLIEDGCVVLLDFVLLDEEENIIIDKSTESEPLAYLHGSGGIVPVLEDHLAGKRPGDSFDVTIEPKDAYGEYRSEAVTRIPREQVPEHWTLELGMQVQDPAGVTPDRIITGISRDLVTLDANHPLAGLRLRFKGTVVDVRKATEEELEEVAGLPG